MLVDLSKTETAFRVEEGLPRPDWKVIDEVFATARIPEDKLHQAYTDAARYWLQKLSTSLGGTYRVVESASFLLLTGLERRLDTHLLNFCELTLQRISDGLQSAIPEGGYGKYVVMIFADAEEYSRYVAYFQSPGYSAASGGMFLDREYGHIALPHAFIESTKRTIAHELAHNCLRLLPIPAWLNEGIATTAERLVGLPTRYEMTRELAERHRAFWPANDIQEFWSGMSFYHPGDAVELSYSLANILVCLICEDRPRFVPFVSHAQWSDGGERAAVEHLGFSLGEAAATFLGDGDWAPNAEAIARWHKDGGSTWKKVEAQTHLSYVIAEREYPRVRYGDPKEGAVSTEAACPDCGIAKGQFHVLDCGREVCPACGDKVMSCGCEYEGETE